MWVNDMKTQRGDTIVEVMLSMAVIGMVLGFSYSTASRALRTGRFAQEQTEALKLAEGQIERLRHIASLPDTDRAAIFDSAAGKTTFCLNDEFKKVLQSDANYASKCTNINGLYSLLITYSTDGTDTFKVRVNWTTQLDTANGTVQIAYRLHP